MAVKAVLGAGDARSAGDDASQLSTADAATLPTSATGDAGTRAAPRVCEIFERIRAAFDGVEPEISQQGCVTSLQTELVELPADGYGAVVDGSADAAIANECPSELEEHLGFAGRSTLLGIDT
jgi:hypothetical protein